MSKHHMLKYNLSIGWSHITALLIWFNRSCWWGGGLIHCSSCEMWMSQCWPRLQKTPWPVFRRSRSAWRWKRKWVTFLQFRGHLQATKTGKIPFPLLISPEERKIVGYLHFKNSEVNVLGLDVKVLHLSTVRKG